MQLNLSNSLKNYKFYQRKSPTRAWLKFIRTHVKFERKSWTHLRKLFAEQEKITLENLARNYGKSFVKIAVEDIVFNTEEEINRFFEDLEPVNEDVFETMGEDAIEDLGISVAFDILEPRTLDFIQNETFHTIRGITQTTATNLRESLRIGITQGEAIEDLRLRIQDVFKGTIRGTAPRARLIARTETTKFMNAGTLSSWQRSGIVALKIWLSARDERVRPTHVRANSDFSGGIPITEKFIVGGMMMEHPGDPAGGVTQVVNCRCSLLSEVAEEVQIPSAEIFSPARTLTEAIEFANVRGASIIDESPKKVTLKQMNDFNKELSKVPDIVNQTIMENNSGIDLLADDGITSHPRWSHLEGEIPRGWPKGFTWSDVPGAGGRKNLPSTILVNRLKESGSESLILHEHFHTYDNINKISVSEKWLKIHSDVDWGSTYEETYPEEALVESFAKFFHGEESRLDLPEKVRQFFIEAFL